MSSGFNPDFNPTGIEGGVDTNAIPWIPLDNAPGVACKPLRASTESGMFSVVVKLEGGTVLSNLLLLGAMDMMMLSGSVTFSGESLDTTVAPGVWGYLPANARIGQISAGEDAEFLANFYGPVAFLSPSNKVTHLLTAMDVMIAAAHNQITLVPNTLAECMQPRPVLADLQAEPLAIAAAESKSLVDGAASQFAHPHFVDTKAVPWFVNPDLPDISLKVLRVSEETGVVSLIVRHNGVAGPHYHLGAADFLVLSGRIGYRAGPPEGYGPGVWFYEPAGARHEATQRIGEEDLIYTANVYGPVQFDDGRDTPIVAVQSWMQYKELAQASGATLVQSTFSGDSTLLAWAPIGEALNG